MDTKEMSHPQTGQVNFDPVMDVCTIAPFSRAVVQVVLTLHKKGDMVEKERHC